MIVRIATEGQYEVPDSLYDELNRLDNDAVAAIEAADETRFVESFGALLQLVRERGTPLGDDNLDESAIILPPPDLTLAEAEEEFTGDGLLPD